MWLNAIASVAFGTVDRIVVGRFLGMAAAAEFTIYLQLSQLIHFVPSSLFTFSFPLFSRLSSAGSTARGEIAGYYRKYRRMIAGIALLFATVICAFHSQLLALFAGSSFHPQNQAAFILLICSFFLLSCNIAPYYLLLGLGASKPVSLISSGSMLGSLVFLMVLLPQGFGLEAAALARLAYAFGTLALVWVGRQTLAKL
jgi:O-antigen/teichoic acid export membrane protein